MNLGKPLDAARLLPDSSQRFPDDGQYQIEIPGVQGAGAAELVRSPGQARAACGWVTSCAVRTHGPASVMAMVCSMCAARLWSALRMVQPSRSM